MVDVMMAWCYDTAVIVIEVAFIISILPDASGADEGGRKEGMPKGWIS